MKESCGKAEIEVERINGADGKVELIWKTKDQSALHGKDYIGGEVGCLILHCVAIVFEHSYSLKEVTSVFILLAIFTGWRSLV